MAETEIARQNAEAHHSSAPVEKRSSGGDRLAEFEESECGGAFFLVHVTQNGIALSVEARVTQAEHSPDTNG